MPVASQAPLRAITLALVGCCAACSGSSEPSDASGQPIVNPTGTCVASGDGSRLGYVNNHGDTWLRDCRLRLAREYWRVFAVASDSAYIVPRPDGDARLVTACNDASSGLAPLLQTYALCGQATASTIARVNDILPADALTITHYLHGMLRFAATSAGVEPYALPGDVLDVCRGNSAVASGVLSPVCSRLEACAQSTSCPEISVAFTADQAAALAPLLNALYGIP